MLRNICCGFIKTKHKISRKIRQKKKGICSQRIAAYNVLYTAVLREPQHIPIFFDKIPPSFIQQIQNP